MTVKDEDGNERELRVGDLVKVQRTSHFLVSRVLKTWHNFNDEGCVDHSLVVSGRFCSDLLKDVTWLSSEPPNDDKGMPLFERQQHLRRNLDRARGRSSIVNGDYALLNRLMDYMDHPAEHHWFWWSVSESCDDPRQVSYATAIRDVDNNARRSRCRMSKFLKGVGRRMGFVVTNEEADRIGELVGNNFPDSYDYEFEIVRGTVSSVYSSCRGGAMSSCMSGSASKYTKWYDDNPDKVGIVKILQGGEFVGRALIWNTDQTDAYGDTAVVVDRVYPCDNGPHTRALHEWCEANGYDYKTCQSPSDGCLKSNRDDYTVTMVPPSLVNTFPYLDTFRYTDDDPEGSDRIKLILKVGRFSFQSTGGGYDGDCLVTCYCCDDHVHEDAAYYPGSGNAYCPSCYDEYFVYLSYTRPNGGRVEREFHRDDTTECENCNDTFSDEHVEMVDTGTLTRDCWCEACIEENASQCCECNEMVSDDIAARDADGDSWCPSCFEGKCAECESCEGASPKVDMFLLTDEEGTLTLCAGCSEAREGDVKPLVEPAPTPSPAPEPVQQTQGQRANANQCNWTYPQDHCFGNLEYSPTCSWANCPCCHEIARRRREYYLRSWLGRGQDDNCPISRIDGLRIEEYVAAPYPNAYEREMLAQQATPSEEGAIIPSTNPFWAVDDSVGMPTLDDFQRVARMASGNVVLLDYPAPVLATTP
jgi:hypothetical protein